ncbi:hypothetical protein GQS_06645 [Thermococcus sp. 4557]|uniref:hypothetical protein n=1 Tax=Thermococcus sp. (strain CGMCC 1.5172 / 4557) TaxID=1042877 RepID=UPI000219E90C|nr:hypothetical protein [Thermococcus sp. 4557]AEK73227.1 hypothetical protein GQS_06645 [Thermococcus sp. 4557]
MLAVEGRFVIPAFMFFISVASTFYLAKYLILQFIITAYIVGFLAVYWKKRLSPKEKTMIVIVVSFPLYFLPAWAVTDNITLALSLGALWDISTGLGIHTTLTKRPDGNQTWPSSS